MLAPVLSVSSNLLKLNIKFFFIVQFIVHKMVKYLCLLQIWRIAFQFWQYLFLKKKSYYLRLTAVTVTSSVIINREWWDDAVTVRKMEIEHYVNLPDERSRERKRKKYRSGLAFFLFYFKSITSCKIFMFHVFILCELSWRSPAYSPIVLILCIDQANWKIAKLGIGGTFL